MDIEELFEEFRLNLQIKPKSRYLLATEKQILIMLIQEKVTHYKKYISLRIESSYKGGYCCMINGIQIHQYDNVSIK